MRFAWFAVLNPVSMIKQEAPGGGVPMRFLFSYCSHFASVLWSQIDAFEQTQGAAQRTKALHTTTSQ
jgi:hypothetical protein